MQFANIGWIWISSYNSDVNLRSFNRLEGAQGVSEPSRWAGKWHRTSQRLSQGQGHSSNGFREKSDTKTHLEEWVHISWLPRPSALLQKQWIVALLAVNSSQHAITQQDLWVWVIFSPCLAIFSNTEPLESHEEIRMVHVLSSSLQTCADQYLSMFSSEQAPSNWTCRMAQIPSRGN